MSCDASIHLFVRCHEHRPETFVSLEVRQSVLKNQPRFSQMQWVQENSSDRSGSKISEKRVPLENIFTKVEVKLNIISKNLIQEHVSAADTVPFVKSKDTLSV